MKVLGLPLITPAEPQTGQRRALATLGEYRELDWYGSPREGFRQRLLTTAAEFKPDLIFAQFQTPDVIDEETARTLVDLCPHCVSWNGDVRAETAPWQFQLGHTGWIMLNSNMRDVNVLAARGHKSRYMQIGFDPLIFRPDAESTGDAPPIIFLGNNYGKMHFPLSDQRREMVDLLERRYPNSFQAYGSGWRGSHTVQHAEEAYLYRSCAIAIGHNHYCLPRYFSDRQLRAMGCGAFLLTADYPDIGMEFAVGHYLDVWKDLNDLLTKIEFWIREPGIRAHVAAAGCNHVHHWHTWDARMENLRDILREFQ